MVANNTLELARQGDPTAIATILSYHLTRRYNTTASVIRLGDYLSIFIEATFAAEQTVVVALIQRILQNLNIEAIATLEICARGRGDHAVRWSQTIDLSTAPEMLPPMTHNLMNPTPVGIEELAIAPSHSESPNTTTGAAEYPPALESAATQPEALPAAAEPDPEFSLRTLLARPEMVALIAFALMLVLWDSYVEWLEEPTATQPLTARKLALRLGVHPKTISRFKHRPNFPTWSQDLDPDGIAWIYQDPMFTPKVG